MRQADLGPGFWRKRGIRGYAGAALNVGLISIGLYMLTAGTYATVESIRENYAAVSRTRSLFWESHLTVRAGYRLWGLHL